MSSLWRCPVCGGQNVSGTECSWPAKDSLWRTCPGRKPGPFGRSAKVLTAKVLTRGLGNLSTEQQRRIREQS